MTSQLSVASALVLAVLIIAWVMRWLCRGISEASSASNARDARRHHLQLGKVIRPKLYGTLWRAN